MCLRNDRDFSNRAGVGISVARLRVVIGWKRSCHVLYAAPQLGLAWWFRLNSMQVPCVFHDPLMLSCTIRTSHMSPSPPLFSSLQITSRSPESRSGCFPSQCSQTPDPLRIKIVNFIYINHIDSFSIKVSEESARIREPYPYSTLPRDILRSDPLYIPLVFPASTQKT